MMALYTSARDSVAYPGDWHAVKNQSDVMDTIKQMKTYDYGPAESLRPICRGVKYLALDEFKYKLSVIFF